MRHSTALLHRPAVAAEDRRPLANRPEGVCDRDAGLTNVAARAGPRTAHESVATCMTIPHAQARRLRDIGSWPPARAVGALQARRCSPTFQQRVHLIEPRPA